MKLDTSPIGKHKDPFFPFRKSHDFIFQATRHDADCAGAVQTPWPQSHGIRHANHLHSQPE